MQRVLGILLALFGLTTRPPRGVALGLGDAAPVAKWAAVCAMLPRRLEIFTLLVLVTPTFWRG